MNGKGDRRRPFNQQKWDEGYERVFGEKTMTDVRAPRCDKCGHQMIRDVRTLANDRPARWYCPTPEKHKQVEKNNGR